MVVDEKSKDMCAACDNDLGMVRMVVAAGGALYCSDECGEYDYDNAEMSKETFENEREDVDPQSIGIEMRQCCNTCLYGGDGLCVKDGILAEQPVGGGKDCDKWISWR